MAQFHGEIFIGLPGVLRNLAGHRKRLEAGVNRGLRIAGLRLLRESQRLVPVDFGILKASGSSRVRGRGFKTVVTVGYSAAYAIYVHENVAMAGKGLPRKPPSKGRYWDPQGRAQAKFLEAPFRRFGPTLHKIMTDNLKIP